MCKIPEHPEIACALATGYPETPKEREPVTCTDCGAELTGDDKVYDYDGDKLCDKCCRERIREEVDLETIAQALGIIVKSAEEYTEEEYE